ncbi:sigma-70 family RNA polymerase sigma factor [Rhodobacteraceae bacterium F11138]|nr:sigma-70 family RNA polymerase sigma factor [Rhodobacteraceae bacterium F11138]
MRTREEIEALLSQVALGDRQAFDSLYTAVSAKLFGVCLRVLKDRAQAEETLQDVFVRIWEKAGQYSVNGLSPMTWLITIARNLSIDRLRALRARAVDQTGADLADQIADPAPGPEARAVAAGQTSLLAACLDSLPDDRASAVRRAYLDGQSYAELAHDFDVPLNTMRTWLRRSLITLKECLSR